MHTQYITATGRHCTIKCQAFDPNALLFLPKLYCFCLKSYTIETIIHCFDVVGSATGTTCKSPASTIPKLLTHSSLL